MSSLGILLREKCTSQGEYCSISRTVSGITNEVWSCQYQPTSRELKFLWHCQGRGYRSEPSNYLETLVTSDMSP